MKLEASSGCVLQYIGNFAVLAGTGKQRKRCREFLQWLLAQRRDFLPAPEVGEVSRKAFDPTRLAVAGRVCPPVGVDRGFGVALLEGGDPLYDCFVKDYEQTEW